MVHGRHGDVCGCDLEHEHARGLGVTTADMGMSVGVARGVV